MATTSPSNLYKEVAEIAKSRRYTSIKAFYKIASISDSTLPKNLVDYPVSAKLLTPEEVEITHSAAEDILQKIRDRIWTSFEVTSAFCKAAAIAQELTNCLTEVLFEEALQRAKQLDDHLEKTGQTVGPFHGLPISLKDCLPTPPHPSSIGIAALANKPTTDEATLVTILRSLGAVFYVKTNVPTAMMMMETNNNIFGECRSPIHKGTSCGGSSGGEGALIALYASPLGIGTDIGGSVRIPSAFCNLYGLKPSFGRFPTAGGQSAIPGQEYILSVNGPMAREVETLRLYSRAVLSEQVAPWTLDHKALPIPWRENVIQPQGRKLRIGIVGDHDGLVRAHPPIKRALQMTKKALIASGHHVIDWSPTEHTEIVKCLLAGFFDFGGAPIVSLLKAYNEPIFGSMKPYETVAEFGENIMGPSRMREKTKMRNELQANYLKRWMSTQIQGGPMDGIIMASAPWAAPRLGVTQEMFYCGYTGVWNLLDFCSCTFPVTFADKNLDRAIPASSFAPLSELDKKVYADYDANFYDGAPVALQMVGKRLEEEKVLEMVEIVANALKKA